MDNKIIDIVELVGRESVYKDNAGNVYKVENGSSRKIGYIGGPFDQNDFPEHSPRYAKFNPRTDKVTSKFHLWRINPPAATRALNSALMTPTAHLKISGEYDKNTRIRSLGMYDYYQATVEVFIPNYIDNKTLVYVTLWSSDYSTGKQAWNEITRDINIKTGEGSGPRHVVFTARSERPRVRAEIYVDLYGNGEIVLPLKEAEWTKEMEDARQANPNGFISDEAYSCSKGFQVIRLQEFFQNTPTYLNH